MSSAPEPMKLIVGVENLMDEVIDEDEDVHEL
jgi:hypothetical protein